MKHAAIPTMYNNVQFRSRLEARWAACFDLLGRRWQYEPIDLNGWIPDFLVDDLLPLQPCHPEFCDTVRKPFLVEIKPITVPEGTHQKAPSDVTQKIEDALGSPRYRGLTDRQTYEKQHSGLWKSFFDALPYRVVLLGTDPRGEWTFERTVGWVHRPEVHKDWNAIWAEAGNTVQWRRPTTIVRATYDKL